MSSADNTREKILLAAGPIFARKGFRSATVREICDTAQVNLASVNYYFGDKQQLYNETVVMARQMRAQQVPEPSWDDSIHPETKLHGFIQMMLERLVAFETEPWQVRLIMREVLKPTEVSRTLVKDYFRPFLETMLDIVDQIVGERLPEEKRYKIGFSIIGQCLYYRFSSEMASMMIGDAGLVDEFTREQLADHIFEFSLAAIRAVRPTHSSQKSSTVR